MPRKNARDKIIDRIPQAHTTRGLTLGATVVGVPPPNTPSDVLRADGSVPLVGALTVSAGVTIDGVDLSAHAASPDAHHAALVGLAADSGTTTPDENDQITLVGGNGLSSSASGSAVTLQLDTPLTISATSLNMAGAGHSHAVQGSSAPGATMSLLTTSASGGLTLGSSTLVVDAAAGRVGIGMTASAARLDITGSAQEAALRVTTSATTAHAIVLSAPSLTSGSLIAATLPADRPVIQAGASGDPHARLTLLPTGLLLGSGSATPDVMMRRGGAQHLIIDNNALGGAVDVSVSRKMTAGSLTPGAAMITSVSAGGPQLRLSYDSSHYMDFVIDNGGSWTIAPTGDVIVDAGGKDVRPQTTYDQNLGLINKKWLSIHAAELHVETLVAQDTIATIGGRILVGPTTVLTTDLLATGGGGGGTPTAPLFVAASSVAIASSATQISQTPPAGTLSGHLLLAYLTGRADSQNITPPAGWSVALAVTEDTAAAPNTFHAVYWKNAGANEPSTSYTFTGSVSGTWLLTLSAWSGADPTTPIHAVASQVNAIANTVTAPSLSPTITPTTLIMLATGSTGKLITPPASMTETWDGSGGTTVALAFGATEALSATGATGTRTGAVTDGSAKRTMAASLVLAPAPATGGGSSTITVKHNQLQQNDIVYAEGEGRVEFMQIASAATGSGPYTYTVVRDLDGTGANAWDAGAALFNTGQTGNGFIDLYSLRGIKSATQAGPTIVGNVRTGTTYNAWAEHWALGNLNGLYDYSATTYGAALGRYTGAGGTTPWLSVDATHGLRIMRGSTKLGQWDTSGTITVGSVAAGMGNLLLDSGGLRLRTNTVVKVDAQTDGDLLIGTNTSAPATTFLSMFSVAQTYNGESMAAGDLLLGDNSANRANLKWTASDGYLRFRGGTTTQAWINTTGAITAGGGDVVLDAQGITIKAPGSSPLDQGTIKFKDAANVSYGTITALDSGNKRSLELRATAVGSVSDNEGEVLLLGSNKTGANWGLISATGLFSTANVSLYVTVGAVQESLILYPSVTRISTGLSIGSPTYDPVNTTNLSVQGTVVAGGYVHPGNQTAYGITFDSNPFSWGGGAAIRTNASIAANGAVLCDAWFRSKGATGWLNMDYGGGLWMQSSATVEIYGGKHFSVPAGNGSIRLPINAGVALAIKGVGNSSATYALSLVNNANSPLLYCRDDLYNWVSSAWAIGSDRVFKTAIEPIRAETGHALTIRQYKRHGSERLEYGLIAQEVEAVLPAVVSAAPDGTLAVDYNGAILAMIHALRQEVAALALLCRQEPKP